MTSQQIQTLLAEPVVENAYNNASVFLNTHFRTLHDLRYLDDELVLAQTRRDDCHASLAISEPNINALAEQTRASAAAYQLAAQELSLHRTALSDELMALTRGLVSSLTDVGSQPTLLEDIETMHRNLLELNHVKFYMQVVEYGLRLSESAVQQISSVPTSLTENSISVFKEMYHFVSKVSNMCSHVEGNVQQSINLVVFLQKLQAKTWADMKSILMTSLLAAAEELKWPLTVNYFSAPEKNRIAFEHAFRNLLELQSIGEVYIKLDGRGEKDGLYALEALVLPVSQRFKYHFEGKRQTNQLHKPEWYFTHVLNVINDHRQFMEGVVQRLLSSSKYKLFNAWHEFSLLLFPLLYRKLRRNVPSLLSHPSLLAHTIYQALSFDAALVEEGFTISDTSAGLLSEGNWNGVVQVILGKSEWFDAWIDGEKRFAEDQFHDIINAREAWHITDDDSSRDLDVQHEMRTTHSARRIAALVEQITDRYSPLPDFTHRARFLISVQLPILELYHGRISSSLDAFETLSSALVRSVPGGLGVSITGKDQGSLNVDPHALTSGVAGVQRLCKACLSSKYIRLSLEVWGEQLFFLELWTEINSRASLRSRAKAHSLLPNPSSTERDAAEATIFHVLMAQYEYLSERAHGIIVQHVCTEVEINLKEHLSTTLSSVNPNEGPDDIGVSQTLISPLALLSTHLAYIRSTLRTTSLTTLYRRIAMRLSEYIMQRQIIYRGNVSLHEAKYIHAECDLWVETCSTALAGALGGGRNRVEAPWSKLLEAGRLIAAEGEAWTKAVDATFSELPEDEWENVILTLTGYSELTREEVGRILRRRVQ